MGDRETSAEELFRDARRRLDNADAMLADFRRMQREEWAKLAGAHLPLLLQSRAEAERHLTSSDQPLRLAALIVLTEHWGPDHFLARESERLVLSEPDPQLRGVAITTLGSCYRGTDDRRIGSILAGFVLDEKEPRQNRQCAYGALFTLRNLPFVWPGIRERPIKEFRFPEDVDWSFVKSF